MEIIIRNLKGHSLFEGDFNSPAEALVSAVQLGADLRCADLYSAYLRGVNLRGAVLCGASLRGADLRGASLYGVALRRADLREASLRGANLSSADLRGVDLRRADLRGADLRCADLRGADLRCAGLCGAYLSGADLRGANLWGADLRGADLYGANLRDARDAAAGVAQTRILPEGSLIGWKKCANGVVVKLRIPEGAKRSNAFSRKCRAEYVEVLEVIGADEGVSLHDGQTVYRAGETVRPDHFCEDWQDECAPGIHFFITREEAEAYEL